MEHMLEASSHDPWSSHYAARTADLSASEVRALFAVASRPEVVSLAGGMPFVSALPSGLLSEVMSRVIRDRGPVALQYGTGQGQPELRERICEIMALEGIVGSPDEVVVTTGSQHAIELLAKLLLDPGDVVLAEGPSYVTALVVFRSFQAEVNHLPTDELGLVPEGLRQAIASLAAAGKRLKFLYTVPTFNNPSGVTLSEQRRQEVLQIARENDLLVVEDNPYGQLYFTPSPPPAPLRSLEADGVVYLGTFSKTLAPGLRVGWVLAPHEIRKKLVLANEAAVLSPSAFTQSVTSEYLRSADWNSQIASFRNIYRERRDALLDSLSQYLPQCTWTTPSGGFYVWLTLPDGIDARRMLPHAVKNLVAYTPGTAFFADGSGGSNIRLAFSFPAPEFIREGIRRLTTTIIEEQRAIS